MSVTMAIYFYWGTTWYSPGQEPAGHFPVVVQSSTGAPPRYSLYRWSELQELLRREPELSLLLPHGERRITLEPDQGFTPTVQFRASEAGNGQRIEVTYNTDDYMFRSIYRVVDNGIEPERLRTGHCMMVVGAVFLGSAVTMVLGWLYSVARQLYVFRSARPVELSPLTGAAIPSGTAPAQKHTPRWN